MIDGPLRIVDNGLGARERATLQAAADRLGTATWLSVPSVTLPRKLPSHHRQTWECFTATPQPLLESWRIARHLDALTDPGDTVLLTDAEGAGGVFALEQSLRPAGARRSVVVAAADSAVLEYLAVAGTIEGVPEAVVHAMDWELVSYRWAAAVAATSVRAVDLLAGLGLEATLVVGADEPRASPAGTVHRIHLPEPVSRIAQTATMLRGLSGALDRDIEVTVSPEDLPDRIWSGSAWEAVSGVRWLFGDRLKRSRVAADIDLIVLGDPFAQPADAVAAARDAGVPVLVAEGSAAATRWPDAPTWRSEADVAAAASGVPPGPGDAPPGADLAVRAPRPAPERARAVSVGVPVFRDVSYLDACLESLLAQTQLPHEILLIDDGSRSDVVDGVISSWETAHPELIRSLRQSPNQGASAARNAALEHMTGDAFVFVDADDELDPRFIEACAAALQGDADLMAVATWSEFFGAYQGIEAKPPFDRRVGSRENTIISTAALVDMHVRELGIRFTPDLAFVFCEDWELWSQIVAAGGAFGLVPEPLARHRVHPSSGGFQRTDLAHSLGKARATAPLHCQPNPSGIGPT